MDGIAIGWATRDITPKGKVRIMGQFEVRVSTGVENPLTCTAMAIENNGSHAVLVSVDAAFVVGAVTRECRRRLAEEVPGLEPHNVCIFATHTHTAPCQTVSWYPAELPEGVTPDEQYGDMLTDALTEVIKDAWIARSPALASCGWTQAVVGHNRRIHYEDNTGKMYGPTATAAFRNIEGSTDHSVNLLFTYDPQGELTGVVVNVPCPSQSRESEPFISADYWHETREEIKRRHGNGVFVLPQCGFAGDQSPHPLIHSQEHLRMLRMKGMIPSDNLHMRASEVTAAECQLIAERIAAAVDETSAVCAVSSTGDLPIAHICRILNLPRRMVTAEEARLCAERVAADREVMATLPADPANPSYTSCHSRIYYNEGVVKRYAEQLEDPTFPAEVHVLRIGDVAMAFVCFEIYLDYGLRVQERSPAVQTFAVQLTSQDTVGSGGYLPTERAVKAGHYGGDVRDNTVGPEGGQVLVDGIVQMLDEMWDAG